MKTILITIVLAMMASFSLPRFVLADDPVKGSTGEVTSSGNTGMGWQQNAIRSERLWTSPVKLSTGLNIGVQGPTLGLNRGLDASWIECCTICPYKESWCNYNADDPRCPD